MLKHTRAALLAAVLTVGATAPAHAQIRNVQGPPQGWLSVSVGRYLDMGRVADGESESTWIFGESFVAALDYHRVIAPGLALGASVTAAAPEYERAIAGAARIAGGRATLISPMLNGRLNTGGAGAGINFYLTGGAGAFIYRLPDIDRWEPDMALYTGAGLDYAAGRNAYFLEWGRFWVYHQGEGVDSNRALHSLIRVGLRIGM